MVHTVIFWKSRLPKAVNAQMWKISFAVVGYGKWEVNPRENHERIFVGDG